MIKSSTALTIIKPLKPPTNLKTLGNVLAKAKTPEAVLEFERQIDGYEAYMRKAGFGIGDMHEVNEARMRARWKLGQMLTALGAKRGGAKGRPALLKELLARLSLESKRAQEAQRIGCLPKIELEKYFTLARMMGELVTISGLVDAARPYWFKERRQKRHRDIAAAATAYDDGGNPYPLIYADPPWQYNVYSEKGLEKSADQHYPTMTDAEIVAYFTPFVPKVGAILMWCTSSNLERALSVLKDCDYTFKSSAVWIKLGLDGNPSTGTGHIFRNQHEVLLYATRGNMPAPQYQPPSVFQYLRGRHSAKPPEIREEIERMYPDFDAKTRCELFSRNRVKGWSYYGNEAPQEAAE